MLVNNPLGADVLDRQLLPAECVRVVRIIGPSGHGNEVLPKVDHASVVSGGHRWR